MYSELQTASKAGDGKVVSRNLTTTEYKRLEAISKDKGVFETLREIEAELNKSIDGFFFIREVFENRLLVDIEKTFEIPFSLSDEGAVTLGEHKEVVIKNTIEEIAQANTNANLPAVTVKFGSDSKNVKFAASDIDGENLVIKNVSLIGQNVRFTDGSIQHVITPATLQAAAPLFDNLKVFVNHAKEIDRAFNEATNAPLRDIRDLVAKTSSPRFDAQVGAIVATISFKDTPMVRDEIFPTLLAFQDTVGISIDGMVQIAEGSEPTEITNIVSLNSVDFVDDPAATKGLFQASKTNSTKEVEGMKTLDELKTNDPEGYEKLELQMKEKLEAQADESSEVEALEKKVDHLTAQTAKLQKEKDTLEAEKKANEFRSIIRHEIAEAKLPEYVVNEGKDESLENKLFSRCKDEVDVKKEISELKDIITQSSSKPYNFEKTEPVEGTPVKESELVSFMRQNI